MYVLEFGCSSRAIRPQAEMDEGIYFSPPTPASGNSGSSIISTLIEPAKECAFAMTTTNNMSTPGAWRLRTLRRPAPTTRGPMASKDRVDLQLLLRQERRCFEWLAV